MPVANDFYVIDERTGLLWSVPSSSVLWRDHPALIPWEVWRSHVVDATVDKNAFVTAEMLISLGHSIDSSTLQTSPLAVVATASGSVVYMHSFQLPAISGYVPSAIDLALCPAGCAAPGSAFFWPCAYSHASRVHYKFKQAASLTQPLGHQLANVQFARRVLGFGDALSSPDAEAAAAFGGRTLRPPPKLLLGAQLVSDVSALSSEDRFAWLHAPVAPFLFRENRAHCDQAHRAAIQDKLNDPWRSAFSASSRTRSALREAQLENSLAQRICDDPTVQQRLKLAVKSGVEGFKRRSAYGKATKPSFRFFNLPDELQSLIVGVAVDALFCTTDSMVTARGVHSLRSVNTAMRALADEHASVQLGGAATALRAFVDTGATTPALDAVLSNGRLSSWTFTRFSCSPITLWNSHFCRSEETPTLVSYARERVSVAHSCEHRDEIAHAVPNQYVAVLEARARRVERAPPPPPSRTLALAETAAAEGAPGVDF
jgi:hypothetical protein